MVLNIKRFIALFFMVLLMRLLIFILMFLSLHVLSAEQYAVKRFKLKESDLVRAASVPTKLYACFYGIETYSYMGTPRDVSPKACLDQAMAAFEALDRSFDTGYVFDKNAGELEVSYSSNIGEDGSGSYGFTLLKQYVHPDYPSNHSLKYKQRRISFRVNMTVSSETSAFSCPNETNPSHTQGPIRKDYELVQKASWCYSQSAANDNHCPDATENDPYILNQTTEHVCFNNSDGTQCRIDVDSNGGFTMPVSFGSQETDLCRDNYTDPNVDTEPTVDPKPYQPNQNKQTDNTDKDNDLDALNQANDNLDAINDNIQSSTQALAERLEQATDEIQNSNEYLDSVADNTYSTSEKLNQTNTLLDNLGDKIDNLTDTVASGDCPPDSFGCVPPTEPCSEGQTCEEPAPEPRDFEFVKKDDATGYWTREYENGIAGIWEEKSAQFQQTEMVQFLETLTVSGSGHAPDFCIDFNALSLGNGCFAIDSRIYNFLSIFFLVVTGFTCRKIIFGG